MREKIHGSWKRPIPVWGGRATSCVYDRHKPEWSVFSPLRRQGQHLRISNADRLHLASEHARKQKLARLDIAVRRGKVWRMPKLEPAWAPELVRYDCQTQTEWKVERIADHKTVHEHGAFRFWRTPLLVEVICAPPLQPPELVDQRSTCARNVTTEPQTE